MAGKATKKERFISAMLVCWEILTKSDKEPSQAKLDGYYESLKDYPIEKIETAFSNAIGTLKFFPVPAELLELIDGGTQQIEDTAQVESIKVINAIKHHGAYQTVKFTDPVTAAVIETGFGGWVRICSDLAERDEKWFLKDFVRLYQVFKRRNMGNNKALQGIIESENGIRGFKDHIPLPVSVDNENVREIENKTPIKCHSCGQIVDGVAHGELCPVCRMYV